MMRLPSMWNERTWPLWSCVYCEVSTRRSISNVYGAVVVAVPDWVWDVVCLQPGITGEERTEARILANLQQRGFTDSEAKALEAMWRLGGAAAVRAFLQPPPAPA